jgi:uncharacterized protein DUF3597
MSVFGSIVSAIFGSKHAAGVTAAASPTSPSPSAGAAKGASEPSPSMAAAPSSTAAAPSALAGTSAGSAAAKPISKADVEAILVKLADDQDEDYDWKRSIVDLNEAVEIGQRPWRPQAIGAGTYTAALDGSAEMNVWLHKQVMTKLAESGGKVPDSLKA